MFVSDVSDVYFVRKVKPYFLSAGEEVDRSTFFSGEEDPTYSTEDRL